MEEENKVEEVIGESELRVEDEEALSKNLYERVFDLEGTMRIMKRAQIFFGILVFLLFLGVISYYFNVWGVF